MWIERLQASLLAERMHRTGSLASQLSATESDHAIGEIARQGPPARSSAQPPASGQGQDVGTQAWAHDPDREN